MSTIATDHLFRHQFGKMVSVLTRIFGLEHLETIEDAVQDTFIQALKVWPNNQPENPEAWLMAAAKNRVVDLFRKIKSQNARHDKLYSGASSIAISEMFSEHEVEDSQLRMIFTACHPDIKPTEQIAFALRSLSGFNAKEIATALLSTEDNIKKRLQRARKTIKSKEIAFAIPIGDQLITRRDRVLEVIYLIFNEGFHSISKDKLIKKDLCGEALRLIKLLLKKETLRHPKVYALLALMCFHASRMESKTGAKGEIIDLRNQDRQRWYFPLMHLGSEAMNKAVENNAPLSSYHYEAAIASEHLKAPSFETTDWKAILAWYKELHNLQPTPNTVLNIAIVLIELKEFEEAFKTLDSIKPKDLGKRSYLYHGTLAEYYLQQNELTQALNHIDQAIDLAINAAEIDYLKSKRGLMAMKQ